jgi:Spy/CpxP family protein refolding chaperone
MAGDKMDITNKSKWQVRLAAILIFVLGFAAGALALNAYKRWGGPYFRSGGELSRQNRFDRMIDSLQLNADQKTQVDQILSDTRTQLQGLRKESEPRVAEIRRQADERLQKVLTPDQWKQFAQERDKMRNSRERRGRGDVSGSP